MQIDDLLGRLQGVKKTTSGFMARCPAHDDKNPSLAITEGREGLLVKCFAGCANDAVCKALGIQEKDLFYRRNGKHPPTTKKKEVLKHTETHEVSDAAQYVNMAIRQLERIRNDDPHGKTELARLEGFIDPTTKATTTKPTTKATAKPSGAGLTLAAYAQAKGLEVEALKKLGCSEIKYMGAPAVRMIYSDQAGEEKAVRFRLALTGDDRFRWRKGTKPLLYGLHRFKPNEALVLVEGESDTQTLLAAGYNALGLPGAGNWKEDRDADPLAKCPAIFLIDEQDKGGETVRKWLSVSSIRDRVKLVTLGEFKDPSGLYLDNPAEFKKRMDTALSSSVAWTALEEQAQRQAHEEAGETCKELAHDRDILARVVEESHKLGCIGEDANAQLVYLALTSRIFKRPCSIALKGCSSSGKSFLAETVLRLMPDEAYYALTAFSEHALAYGTEPLMHRFLVLFEANGMEGDMQSYLIRSLLSEGRIKYETVEKCSEGLVPKLIEREGPTGLLVTTTKTRLHPENETRLLSLTTTDTAYQTAQILAAIAEGGDPETRDLSPWHALQTWISTGPTSVSVPFALKLASLIPPVAVRLRRDFTTLLSLVKAHAALHQATRERSGSGEIVATIEDYAAVRELVLDLISAGVESTVPEAVRETVSAIGELQQFDEEAGVTVAALAKKLGLDKTSAARRARGAADRGYAKNLESRRGRQARYLLEDAMPDDLVILPLAEELYANTSGKGAYPGCSTRAVETEGVNTPPPPPMVEVSI